MKTINDFSFAGRKALVRVDFNVPLNDKFEVTDLTRLKAAVPTIMKILSDGGNPILMSHLGRPKGGFEEKFSLKHIVADLSKLLATNVKFAVDSIGESAESAVAALQENDVLLLENVRFYKQETAGDENFAVSLAKLGDIYVNDAFGTAHRAHASTTIVAKHFKDKCCGFVMQQELENAEKVLGDSKKTHDCYHGRSQDFR